MIVLFLFWIETVFFSPSLTPCSLIWDCRTPQFTEPFSPKGLQLVFFAMLKVKWL